jgi:hypothetical protein
MRKTILGHKDHSATFSSNEWFGVEAIAGIAVTSEADDAPVENVLYPDRDTGARAEEPGHRSSELRLAGQRTSGTFNLSSGNHSSQGHRNLRCAVLLLQGSGER